MAGEASGPGLTLGSLAERLGLELRGDAERAVRALASVESAGPDELAFVVDVRWRDRLAACRAGAVIVPPALAADAPGDHLVSADPYASYARASWLLAPESRPAAGVHPSAVLGPGAVVAPSAAIGPWSVVGEGSEIGEDVVVGAHAVIGAGCRIGRGTRLFPRVTLGDDVTLGPDCRVQSGAVIGGDGFGYAPTADGWCAIRQAGGVRIGARVHVGANTTIDRGALDPTRIADGVILDNQIQIAHNVRIGENTAIAGCTGIAGSTVIGRNCLIGGACDIVGHVEIADGVVLNAASFVSRSVLEPGRYGSAPPLLPERRWRRAFAALGRLDELARRLARLERAESGGPRAAGRPRRPAEGDGRGSAAGTID